MLTIILLLTNSSESLQVTGYRLQVAGYRLQVTGYRLQVTGYRLQVTGCNLQHCYSFCFPDTIGLF